MLLRLKHNHDKKKLDEALKKLKPSKAFKASHFKGKVKWDEDPLAYQKRIRSEWD